MAKDDVSKRIKARRKLWDAYKSNQNYAKAMHLLNEYAIRDSNGNCAGLYDAFLAGHPGRLYRKQVSDVMDNSIYYQSDIAKLLGALKSELQDCKIDTSGALYAVLYVINEKTGVDYNRVEPFIVNDEIDVERGRYQHG